MAYAFKQIEAHDPNNPGLVAPNASVTIFEPGDPTKTPLTLTTLTGDPLPNPVTVNGMGYGPAFMHATLPQVAWSGGGLTGTFESYEGMRDEAVAARTAAETAAADAAADATVRLDELIAAGEFVGPAGPLTNLTVGTVETTSGNPLTDEIIAAEIVGGTETRAALNEAITSGAEDKLSASPEVRSPEPLVAFTFDDGPVEDFTVIRPLLESKGVKGVFAINSGNVGTSSAKLSWAQVRQLRDEGHEIIDHSTTHANLNTADTSVLAAQIDASYDKFLTEGIRPVGFCWPFADSNPTSRARVRRYYRYALGGAGGTTQPLHTYAIKRVEINDATSLATHQTQIDAAITNKELLIFLVHTGTTGTTGLTTLGQVIDYANASAAAVVTTAEAFERVGNILDTGDLPGAASYTVIDGQGRLKTSDGSAVLVGAINPLAAAAPNTYKAGVVTFQRVSGPANTDWPYPGNAVKIETDRVDTTNVVYTVQEITTSIGMKLSRRATSDTAWGPWYGSGSLGSDANAGNLTPEAFPIGIVTHTVPLSGSTGPSGKQGTLITTRGSATIHTYTTQIFHEVSNATMHRRMGATATTWTAWKVVTLT